MPLTISAKVFMPATWRSSRDPLRKALRECGLGLFSQTVFMTYPELHTVAEQLAFHILDVPSVDELPVEGQHPTPLLHHCLRLAFDNFEKVYQAPNQSHMSIRTAFVAGLMQKVFELAFIQVHNGKGTVWDPLEMPLGEWIEKFWPGRSDSEPLLFESSTSIINMAHMHPKNLRLAILTACMKNTEYSDMSTLVYMKHVYDPE